MGIDARRVKAEIRPTLILYQRDCFHALFRHFFAPLAAGHQDAGQPLPPPAAPPFLAAIVAGMKETLPQSHRQGVQMWRGLTARLDTLVLNAPPALPAAPEEPPFCRGCAARRTWERPPPIPGMTIEDRRATHPLLNDGPITGWEVSLIIMAREHARDFAEKAMAEVERYRADAARMAAIRKLLTGGDTP